MTAISFPLCVAVLSGTGHNQPIERERIHIGPPRAEITSVKSLSPPKGSLVILVANNNVFARNLLIRELSRDGHFVVSAANSEEVIALLGSFAGQIELFLSNSDLPGRVMLTEGILRERPGIRAITISAGTQAELIERGQTRGALPDALRARIRSALTNQGFSDAAEV